jgi:Fe2+ or Zn2+ uptake regulation protein
MLQNTDTHPTADWIYDEVRKVIPNISKGTVYRNLKVLQETGQISEIKIGNSVTRYEGKLKNHYHFHCQQCGRIFDLDEPVQDTFNDKIAAKTGFKVLYHQLEFRGLCDKCQQKK